MGDQHSLANKVAFAFVAGSAGIQAAQQALKEAPDLVARTPVPDMNAGAWNYLPLGLVSVAVLLWIAQRAYDLGFAPVAVPFIPNIVSEPEAPPEPPQSTEREFMPASFSRSLLSLLRRSHTDAELNSMLRPHVGRWVRLTLYLSNAIPGREDIHAIVRPSKHLLGSSLSTFFALRNESLFAAMRRGTKFDCDLQIVQDRHSVRLQNGELL